MPSFNDTIALFLAKSNNRTRGQFEYDVTWFCFYFDFVRLQARCGCCSIACLYFPGWLQIEYSFVAKCSGVGGQIENFGKKILEFIWLIWEWPKNTPTAHFMKSWYISPWCIALDPPTISHERVLKMWITAHNWQLHTQEYKATKKQIVRLQLNEKKSKQSQTKLMSWYWKQKPTWRKDIITYNIHPEVMFSFNWLVIIWRGRVFVLDVQGQGVEKFWT